VLLSTVPAAAVLGVALLPVVPAAHWDWVAQCFSKYPSCQAALRMATARQRLLKVRAAVIFRIGGCLHRWLAVLT
jgi:hypothetical protein